MTPDHIPTPPSFQTLSRDVVKQFLQTAVVLDDEAFVPPRPTAGTLVEPDPDVSAPESMPDDQTADGPSGNSLDAEALINSFADLGMVCAVLTPKKDDDGKEATVSASRRADIVILDWHLGDQGQRATQIMREIAADDASSTGRLRLFAVYTAEPDLRDICDRLAAQLPAFEKRGSARAPSLVADHARVLFIQKGSSSTQVGAVAEADLPDRLIDEFAQIGQGLLANVAFGSIAAIRRGTHHLLARFHSALDAPFISHRILLETPEDAEQYALDLLSSELAVLLQDSDAGRRFAGKEAIRALLSQLTSGEHQLRLMKAKDTKANTQSLSVDELMHLVERGPAGLGDVPDQKATKTQMSQLHQRVELLFSENLEAGRATHRAFARLSARAREHATVPLDFRAKLDLGAVVRSDQCYLLCIQPRCDAVRLDDTTNFAFAHLKKSDSRFDLIVQDGDSDVALKLEESIAGLRYYPFTPNPDTRTVSATTSHCFTDANGRSFTWLCDLRGPIAQRFVQRIASTLSRIGLDEFEWQRRHAKG